MCTVIFLPQHNAYALASIRDESPHRPTVMPELIKTSDTTVLCPTDSRSGGTWFGTNGFGNTIVLLNGAFINHLPNTRTFRTSRGNIVKELLNVKNPIGQLKEMNLSDIEPFTLIVKQDIRLLEFRWNGREKHFRYCDPENDHIWSSSTLYTREIQEKRARLFWEWLQQSPSFDLATLTEFLTSYTDPVNGFFMKRSDNLSSISFSYLEANAHSGSLMYHDYTTDKVSNQTIIYESLQPSF